VHYCGFTAHFMSNACFVMHIFLFRRADSESTFFAGRFCFILFFIFVVMVCALFTGTFRRKKYFMMKSIGAIKILTMSSLSGPRKASAYKFRTSLLFQSKLFKSYKVLFLKLCETKWFASLNWNLNASVTLQNVYSRNVYSQNVYSKNVYSQNVQYTITHPYWQ
jgi:hypothetical protein